MNEESGCLTVLATLLLGGWSVDTILSWFYRDIPAIGDMLIGVVFVEFSLPIAVVGSILKFFGVF